MDRRSTIRKCICTAVITLLMLLGIAVSGVMLTTAKSAFSQAPEPKCVCAECGHPCGSGHAKTCSSYTAK
jgi:hypothetical protein